MNRIIRKLSLNGETVRALGVKRLGEVRGGVAVITESDVCGVSDASTCPSHDWSCINMSCTRSPETA